MSTKAPLLDLCEQPRITHSRRPIGDGAVAASGTDFITGSVCFANSEGDPIDLAQHVADLHAQVRHLRIHAPRDDRATLLVSTDDVETVAGSLAVAVAAATVGMKVTLFFAAHGIFALGNTAPVEATGSVLERIVQLLAPEGADELAIARMYLLGAAATQLTHLRRDDGDVSCRRLVEVAQERGARFLACRVSMELLAVSQQEIGPAVEAADAIDYLAEARLSGLALAT